MISSLRKFSGSEAAQERLRIIGFYIDYGEKATKKAFGIDRKTVWVWKKRLERGNHHLSSLTPSSTRPRKFRKMTADKTIVSFISQLRQEHYRMGKEKIKPLLDKHCQKLGIATVSVSTIGKIIKRHRFFSQRSGRIYHQPSEARSRPKRVKRLRVKHAPRPDSFGHLQMDTVVRLTEGIRLYFYSAIDIKLKFSLSLPYPSLNSKNTLEFFKKLELVYPGIIKSVQTDNGLEFLGVFDQYLKQRNLPHYFIYPRCPRINGVVERYQRTLQEEFLNPNIDLVHYPKLLASKLADYLLFYNTVRAHHSLGNLSPMGYLIKEGGMSKMCVTHTCVCLEIDFRVKYPQFLYFEF